jgi:hypothetical protein
MTRSTYNKAIESESADADGLTEFTFSFKDFPDVESLKDYDPVPFERAKDRICSIVKDVKTDREIGIAITMDEMGDWFMEDLVEGNEKSVTYDFSAYREEGREPQGTVHFHPKIDTEDNFLPSIGDIFASADTAYSWQGTTGQFACGIINHARKGTLSLVSAKAYRDEGFEKIIDEYNDAMDEEDRKRVLQLEKDAIKHLMENHLIKIYKWKYPL